MKKRPRKKELRKCYREGKRKRSINNRRREINAE
jgi:hypothetical protein